MFCDKFVIHTKLLTKSYKIYNNKINRIKQYISYVLRFIKINTKKNYYTEFQSLKNVSIAIKPGTTVGLIGRNGAGKSTLLKILTGTTTPTKGVAAVKGRVIALLELGAGFNPEFSGLENIYFYSAILGVKTSEVKAQEKKIIEFADIGPHINQPVKSYSSGMFARLAFSVAIHLNPDVLIVDEALSVGDTKFQLKCFSKISELKNQGKTIFYVSHDTYSIRTLCDFAIWIDNGEIKKKGDPNTVVNEYLQSLERERSDNSIDCQSQSYSDLELRLDKNNKNITIQSGKPFELRFIIKNNGTLPIKYIPVFNIYRAMDNFYISGATLLMSDNIFKIIEPMSKKEIQLNLKNNNLLSGAYRVRLAINDDSGMGVLAEAKFAYLLTVEDLHEGEGLINLSPQWSIKDDH